MAQGINGIKIPEKAYFTFEEIAGRWGVDIATVEYYVWDVGDLRPAFSIRNFYERAKYRLYKLGFERGVEDQYPMPDALVDDAVYTSMDGSDYDEEFLYINSKNYHFPEYWGEDDAFEDACSNGRVPHLAILSPDDDPYKKPGKWIECFPFLDFEGRPVKSKILIDEFDGKYYRCRVAVRQSNEFIITRQERDRFEAQFGEADIKMAGRVQEDNTLRALGVMALLLSKQSPKYQIGERPNMEVIKNAVNELADQCGLSSSGLAALHKKIADALKLLEK